MKNLYILKQIIILLIIVIIIGAITLSIIGNKKAEAPVAEEPMQDIVVEVKESVEICYYLSKKTNTGLYDVSWLRLSILDKKINGEFRNLPAEKDSKVGSIEGAITGALDPQIMGRKEVVWWNSFAEGMNVKEELAITWGDGSASVGYGEMVDRGDGVYVYKDKTKIYYQEQMNQMDCTSMEEKLAVEKYIRENIKTIAMDKPVLGGSWYVVSININPTNNSGEIVYEDGHIQSKANIIYEYDATLKKTMVTKFEIKK